MSTSAVHRAANSAPGARDYEGERRDLLARADAARAEHERIDCNAAAEQMLQRNLVAADESIARVRSPRKCIRVRAKISVAHSPRVHHAECVWPGDFRVQQQQMPRLQR